MNNADEMYKTGIYYHYGNGKDVCNAFIYYQKSAKMGHVGGTFNLGFCYENGIGVEKDKCKAFIYYQKSADMGHIGGIFNTGYCYENGIGVEKDKCKAFIYYQKSADMGHVGGIFNTGYCYENGIGVEKDKCKEFIYYQKSAVMGHIGGIFNTGYYYENGIGVEKDKCKAFIYYQRSADMGHIDGIFNTGYCYENGIGVEKNKCKAFNYYQRSADMGHEGGIFITGYCYENGIGIEKNKHEAFIYYKKSADIGNANGTCALGDCYRYGIGIKKDENMSFIYYQKSADMGHAEGTFNVGYCYDNGIGVEKDINKAFIYYKKSADMGNANGTNSLGQCYRTGSGVRTNVQKAFMYFQQATDMGHIVGKYNLACCYIEGISVEKNERKAFEYYQNIADKGYPCGMYQVAYCYEHGLGVAKNLQIAIDLYKKLKPVKNYWLDGEQEVFMGKEFNKFNKLRTYAAITKNLVTESPEWTSGNEQIDAFIHQIHSPFSDKFFEWIPYEKFINVEYLAKGGFGQVFTAWWPEGKISGYNFDTNCVERSVIDMVDIFRPEDGKGLKVALKLLSSKTNMEALCDELRSYLAVSRFRNSFVVECYGMTKNPDGKYLLVLQYGGKILKQVLAEEIDKKELTWNKMIYKVRDIAAGLSGIHIIGNRIHRDLHSGNIVQRGMYVMITDFGLCCPIIGHESSKRYGMVPYVAPEILKGGEYTMASDIYSMGSIMYEIATGHPPFYDRSQNEALMIEICLGLRPNPIPGAPKFYQDFINRCWENDPQKRPTSFDLHMQALSWYSANDQAIREQLNKAEEYLRKNPPKRNRRPPETYTRLDTQKVLDAISGRIPTQDVTVEKTYTQEIGATYTIKENISTPTEQEVVEPVQEIIDTSTELIPDELTAYLISYWLKDAPWLNNIRKKEIARRII